MLPIDKNLSSKIVRHLGFFFGVTNFKILDISFRSITWGLLFITGGQLILPFKHKWQLTWWSSVAFCYIKRKKINNEGVDEDIDSFQRGSFNGSLRWSFPLCCESLVSVSWFKLAVQEFSTLPEASAFIWLRRDKNGLLKEAEEQMLKGALSRWKVPSSADGIVPG